MRFIDPTSARLLDVYLVSYPGWLSDHEAISLAGLTWRQVHLSTFRALEDDGLIEVVPGQTVQHPWGKVPACRITDAGAVALRERKARGRQDEGAEPREPGEERSGTQVAGGTP